MRIHRGGKDDRKDDPPWPDARAMERNLICIQKKATTIYIDPAPCNLSSLMRDTFWEREGQEGGTGGREGLGIIVGK